MAWINGCLDRDFSDWTTDLLLEVIAAASSNVDSGSHSPSYLTVVHHFCSDRNIVPDPETIIQDLLFQVLEAHIEKFDQNLCQARLLTRHRFRDAAVDSVKLWEIFREILILSETPALLMVIDNVDAIFLETSTSEDGVQKLQILHQQPHRPRRPRDRHPDQDLRNISSLPGHRSIPRANKGQYPRPFHADHLPLPRSRSAAHETGTRRSSIHRGGPTGIPLPVVVGSD
jgi:hypothetical protein